MYIITTVCFGLMCGIYNLSSIYCAYSQERERLEELKEAQDRVTRRRVSSSSTKPGRDRSRSKERIRKKSAGTEFTKSRDVQQDKGVLPPGVEFLNGFEARTEGTDSGVGVDAIERDQVYEALQADTRDLNGEPIMFARATKAIQEHVKDVTEKTRATCCIGKPPVKKESYNNQINSQYHGGFKETNFNHHPIHTNVNGNYQQENQRPPPAYTQSPPPPYHSEHNTHTNPKTNQQPEHNTHSKPNHQQEHNNHKHNHQPGHHPHVTSSHTTSSHVTSPHRTHVQYPGDTRTPPPPIVQAHLIINNNNGHISSPRPEQHQYIVNENTGTTYVKGRLLGKVSSICQYSKSE